MNLKTLTKRKKISVIAIVALACFLVATPVAAYFFDTENSTGNSFTAGTLDLTVNGQNGDNTVIFAVENMVPGNQPTGTYVLQNIGTLQGILSIAPIIVTNTENTLTEPEVAAGDTTADLGELGAVLNLRLYVDADKDGYYSTGDVMLYNGLINDVPSTLSVGTLGAGATTNINAVVDWWDTPSDNLAQSDSLQLDLAFKLLQA